MAKEVNLLNLPLINNFYFQSIYLFIVTNTIHDVIQFEILDPLIDLCDYICIMSVNEINAVILCGGLSTRMGQPKALLRTRNNSYLFEHALSITKELTSKQYLSIKSSQLNLFPNKYHFIIDNEINFGPIGGLKAGFENLNSHVLLCACDMPYLNAEDVALLINSKTESDDVVCFKNENDLVEPLFALFDIKCKKQLFSYIEKGHRSLKIFITTLNCKILVPNNYNCLISLNEEASYRQYLYSNI